MAWRAICDRCGFNRLNHELRREWTGLMVCRETCWEARHPQDFVRGKADRQNPPWVRPEPEDNFISVFSITLEDGSLMLLEDSADDSLDPLDTDDAVAAETDL
jgi:hypothetical protein